MRICIMTFIASLFAYGASGQSLAPQAFENKFNQSKFPQLVDVRTPQEYEAGHLKDAVNIDVKGADFRTAIEKLDKSRPVFVYCRSGVRSKTAISILKEAGFKEVYELDGGINAWIKAGKPVVQ